jgi:glycosyltransferase involved in cell wall biosynthesis
MLTGGRHSVSVIIATFNRAHTLQRTLEALGAMQIGDFEQEWIVVDNNSDDDTAQVVEEYAYREPRLQYRFEQQQGKSFALNTGISAARGNIIAFTDDDVLPTADWLVRMVETYDRLKASAAVVGGRVLVEGNMKLPEWLHRDLVGFLGLVDRGDEERIVQPPECLIGANMSARRDVLERVGGFRTDLGPRGRNAVTPTSEDCDLCYRVAAVGEWGHLVYAPHLVTYHTMLPEKLTRGYFRQRAIGEGLTHARLYPPAGVRDLLLQTLRSIYYLLRLPMAWLVFSRVPDERFLREFKILREGAALVERWRIGLRRPRLPRRRQRQTT